MHEMMGGFDDNAVVTYFYYSKSIEVWKRFIALSQRLKTKRKFEFLKKDLTGCHKINCTPHKTINLKLYKQFWKVL